MEKSLRFVARGSDNLEANVGWKWREEIGNRREVTWMGGWGHKRQHEGLLNLPHLIWTNDLLSPTWHPCPTSPRISSILTLFYSPSLTPIALSSCIISHPSFFLSLSLSLSFAKYLDHIMGESSASYIRTVSLFIINIYILFSLITSMCSFVNFVMIYIYIYIKVQHLIEKCLIFNMTKEECMDALSKHANIKPVITSTGLPTSLSYLSFSLSLFISFYLFLSLSLSLCVCNFALVCVYIYVI